MKIAMSFDKKSFYLKYFEDDNTVYTLKNRRVRLIVDYLRRIGRIENLLDIGCGRFSLAGLIKDNCNIKNYYGCDLIDIPEDAYKDSGVIYAQCDFDTFIPFSDIGFDVILCSEVIEHLFMPDNIFKFAAKTLSENGILLITTPNLAVWYNRVLLLLGFQPSFSEVSVRYNVGKLYTTYRDKVSGHLRMFTLRALVELGHAYGLKTVYKASTSGDSGVIGRLTNIFSVFPSLGNNLVCVMKKGKT